MEEPLCSVIVPVYNVEPYINRCIASIITQTYKNLEIILVDDGSTDGSGEICDSYAAKDRRVKVIHKKNGGQGTARKTGLGAAKGSHVTFVDSDDFIEPQMLESLMCTVQSNCCQVVVGGTVRDYGTRLIVTPNAVSPGMYEGERLVELHNTFIDTGRFFKPNIDLHLFGKVYETALVRKHQTPVPDEIRIGEDISVVYPLLFSARSIYVSDECCYHYCVRSDSIMGTVGRDGNSSDPMLRYLREALGGAMHEDQFILLADYLRLLREPQNLLRYDGGILWPFGTVSKSDPILLYGAGKFGMAMRSWLLDNGFTVAAWVDSSVSLPETVRWEDAGSVRFGKVIVAVLLYEAKESIIQGLILSGVHRNDILSVTAGTLLVGQDCLM